MKCSSMLVSIYIMGSGVLTYAQTESQDDADYGAIFDNMNAPNSPHTNTNDFDTLLPSLNMKNAANCRPQLRFAYDA